MNSVVKNDDLDKIGVALTRFSKVDAGIAALREKYGAVIYDVATVKGMDDAKEARAAIREPRYEVEKIRKEAKAPILALGKTLDKEAARITEALLKIEAPIDDSIKAEEGRKEAERQAKIEAEKRRVADIQERIVELGGAVNAAAHCSAAHIAEHIDDLEKIPVDESFAEFQPTAVATKARTLATLRDMHAKAKSREDEAGRLRLERIELDRIRKEQEATAAAERAELAKLRAEQDARDKAERERLAAIEREQRAIADAQAAEVRKEREALEAERRRQQAEADAETARQAEQQRRQEVERARLEAEAADLELQREALAKAPVTDPACPKAEDIIDAVSQLWSVTEGIALNWLRMIDWDSV